MRFSSIALSLGFCAALGIAFPVKADDQPASAPAVDSTAPIVPASTFEEMLAHVYETSPQIKAQRDSLRILDERTAQAVAGFRPNVSFDGAYGEERVAIENQPWQYGPDHELGLTVIQPIYNGATWGQWHAAKSRVMAGRAELLATEQKVLTGAITAWLELCEKQTLLDLDHDNLQLTQAHADATNERFKAGDSTQTDVAVAESRLADGMARQSLAEAARDAARSNYERVTGLQAQAPHFEPLPANLPESREDMQALIQQNPEYAQAQEEINAAENDIDTASGARGPNIFLRGSMGEQNSPSLGLVRLRTDSITINMSLPLYQGGIEYSREREAEIAYHKSQISAVDVTRSLNEEMQQAWDNFRAAQAVIATSRRAVDASTRALEGIQEEQKRGTRTLTEVLDAQAQLLNARITDTQAQKNLRLEAYHLLAASGRLTAQGLNLPTRLYDPAKHYDETVTRWFGTSVDDPEKKE